MSTPAARVVMASVLPLGERDRVGVLVSDGRFQAWEGDHWGRWYRRHEVRAIRNASSAVIQKTGLNLQTWEAPL